MWARQRLCQPLRLTSFYQRLNKLLREHGFDDFVGSAMHGLYAKTMGRPGLPPGIYFGCS
jgi:hypothetical protein